jgi:putative DNA primase/helicase
MNVHQDMARRADVEVLRHTLSANGYQPVAVAGIVPGDEKSGKNPIQSDWQNLTGMPAWSPNTGILCVGLRAIDVDEDDPEKAAGIRRLIEARLGPGPVRVRSNSGRCLLLYRAAEGVPVKQVVRLDDKPKGSKVEVLGKGQQFVAFGKHWTDVELEWANGSPLDTPRDDLPSVNEETLKVLLDDIFEEHATPAAKAARAAKEREANRLAAERAKAASGPRTAFPDDIADAREALHVLPNDYDRESWVRVGMAAYEGGLDFEDFDEWSRPHPTYDPKHTRKTWDSFKKGVRAINKATLFWEVSQRVPGWKSSQRRIGVMKKVSLGDARLIVAEPPAADSKPRGDAKALNAYARQHLDKWVPGLGEHVERRNDGSYVVTADGEEITLSPTDGDVIGAYASALGMPREDAKQELADRLRFKLEVDDNAAVKAAGDRARAEGVDDRLTHDAVATLFATAAHATYRYCHTTGAWFVWNGSHWRKDETEKALQLIRQMSRRVSANESGISARRAVRKASFAKGAEQFARGDDRLAVTSSFWDRNPLQLGTPGGTVDLRTGETHPGDPADGIRKQTAVAPALTADCPRWLTFLDEATGGDAEMIRFLQQWCGYNLSGETREHALVFVYGPGKNGKSVFLNIVTQILGDYAVTAAMDTFVASRGERHPTDLAMLLGARMVTASETEEGRAWAEARIKQITGGDPITARFMRQDFFTYTPQFKLTIVGNHKPSLHSVDEATRRRFNIVPFTQMPARPDKDLEQKLKAEAPGILRWMIEGCLDYRTNGLLPSSGVAEAIRAYFEDQDLLGQWIEEKCDAEPDNPHKWELVAELFASWTAYAGLAGEAHGSVKSFSENMRKRGFERKRGTRGIRGLSGIRLRQQNQLRSGE